MGILKKVWKHFTKSKNPESPRFRRDMAEKINGLHVKYVTERREDNEDVIGRNGGVNIRDNELIVFASSDVVFRAEIDKLSIWELLSNDGAVLTGPDLEHGGIERTIIIHYTYYRK